MYINIYVWKYGAGLLQPPRPPYLGMCGIQLLIFDLMLNMVKYFEWYVAMCFISLGTSS